MQIVHGTAHLKTPMGPYAVGIGVFDGVHLGHRALLTRVLEQAQKDGIASMAYTFHPHPARALNLALAPKLIETIEVRLERLAQLGFNTTVVEPFTRAFAATSAEAFVREILHGRFQAKHVVVGSDFVFGHKQGGNVALLTALGKELGFEVHPIELIRSEGIPASSTKVREFIREGKVRGATLLLGRPFNITGLVMRGAGRGQKLSFATANVATNNELLPATGVYAAQVSGNFGQAPAVVNVGYAPTFGENVLRIEAHLLDYDGGHLYGLPLSVDFIDRIRDERRFENVDALKEQIAIDIEAARQILNEPVA